MAVTSVSKALAFDLWVGDPDGFTPSGFRAEGIPEVQSNDPRV